MCVDPDIDVIIDELSIFKVHRRAGLLSGVCCSTSCSDGASCFHVSNGLGLGDNAYGRLSEL